MSSFTGALVVEDLENGNWKVDRSFSYDVGELGSGHTVIIPAGFNTDYASIPRVLWNILPPNGQAYDRAAVVHDYLYRGGFVTVRMYDPETATEYELHQDPTRAETDSILNEAMAVSGVGRVKRWMIYSGVRVGGGAPWAKGHNVSKN